jgi:beta-lactamase class A
MPEDLGDPHLHHKFVSQIENRAPGARLFRKSGTWKQWHSDVIMVRGTRWRNYILVGLIESEDGESILRRMLPAVETIIVPEEFAGSMYES